MRNLNKVHLSGLRAVEAVGRLGNLAAAAEELGVTAGAISQQVGRTEEALGRPLFRREARGLQLTPLGRDVCARLTEGMAALSRAVALVDEQAQAVLTVSVAPVFASKWLVWRLGKFHAQDPGVRVRIDADMALVNPDSSGVDACIRVGRGNWRGVNAECILDHRVFPVCSPEVGKGLSTPADLAHVPIITEPNPLFQWDVWLEPNRMKESVLGTGPVYSDASLCLDAAIAGQGVFLAWETLACDALQAGRLVAPFPGRYESGLGYWFVTGRSSRPNKHAALFKAWLKSELELSIGRDQTVDSVTARS